LILDYRTVRRCLDMKGAIRDVERAFRLFGKGRTQMPAKIYLDLKAYHGDFRAMPVFVEGMGAALKWVNVHPGNRKKGLPTVMATVILSDPRTGFPMAIMDGTQITNYRTGAAGGVAAKYLARKDSSVLALVGCGEQAGTQLLALEALFVVKEVRVWGYKTEHIKAFRKILGKKRYKVLTAKSIQECVRGADIVATTTPSRKPLIRPGWLKEGAHVNAIGADAPGKHELDPRILKKARIIIDDWRQASHSGEINVALKKGMIDKRMIGGELADIVNGKISGRTDDKQITIFDSTGLAIQDVALAYTIYKKAKRQKWGRFINFV